MIDKKSYRLLKRMYRADRLLNAEVRRITGYIDVECADPCTVLLEKEELIRSCYTLSEDHDGFAEHIGFEITLRGRAYVKNKRRSFWGFFLPYAITTAIALLSLVTTLAANWDKVHAFLQSLQSLRMQCP